MSSPSLPERFAEQVSATPDATAVSSAEVTLTYRQLDERANRLANHLRGLGAGPHRPVAVLMARSADVVVVLLAVTKAGSCYVPVHGAFPPDLAQRVVDGLDDPILVTDSAMRDRGLPRAATTVVVGEVDGLDGQPCTAPPVRVDGGDTAYVLHTSGSTGQPKGVVVTHSGLLGLADDPIWAHGQCERVLMIAPHAFSVATFEVWVPLLHGGEVVVAPEPLELDMLEHLLRERRITCVHLTAGLFRTLAADRPGCLAGVREVITGGDVVSPQAVARVREACPATTVRITYGATETSLFTVTTVIPTPYRPDTTVAVGRAMSGVGLHILDERLEQVPREVAGELYIAGPRLASGYLGRPDLTAERFVADPSGSEGGRMYRTGDLARWTGDGQVDLLGRADQQVKILGFRVELAEVEAALAAYPGLAQVAVIAKEVEPGDKRLAAYVVPGGGDFDLAGLQSHAQERLPRYMVPNAFVVLDMLPLTANGKLDRDQLPVPDYDGSARYRKPTTRTEVAVCAMIAEVLDLAQVGIDDNFFELGGQSLVAMRLISRIRSGLGVDLPLSVLFDAPTVASLAKQIDENGAR